MQVETRAFSEIREIDEAEHAAHIRLVTYNRADTYGSTWLAGVFDESLRSGHVPAVWGHDRNQIFGSVREYDLQPEFADVNVAFADLDAVPLARSVYSLMKDRHVRQSSFGFSRVAGGTISKRSDPNFTPSQPGERERMARADLVEVSVVLKGSVPDNGVLAVRAEAAAPEVDIATLILTRAPHLYKPTNGEGSVCAACGALPDAKVHSMTRATILDLAASPVTHDDPHLLLRAADAAVDVALGLLTPEAASDPATAALGLLMAADAMLDRSQDLLNLPDSDDDDGPVGTVARAFAEPAWEGVTPNGDKIVVPAEAEQPPPGAEPDEVERALAQLLLRRDPKKPYGPASKANYADPGYQEDGKSRYPLDTEAHVRSAWSYIHQESNRKFYTAEQLKTIEGRIRSAARRYGIEIADDSGK